MRRKVTYFSNKKWQLFTITMNLTFTSNGTLQFEITKVKNFITSKLVNNRCGYIPICELDMQAYNEIHTLTGIFDRFEVCRERRASNDSSLLTVVSARTFIKCFPTIDCMLPLLQYRFWFYLFTNGRLTLTVCLYNSNMSFFRTFFLLSSYVI